MSDEVKHPWMQGPEEPDEAYAHFLVYLHLGPARSLRAASEAWRNLHATKRDKTRRVAKTSVPGNWAMESVEYVWTERVAAWDVHTIADAGKGVVVKYVHVLDLSLAKVLMALQGEIRPKSWKQILESIQLLGGFIPQETVASLGEDSAGHPPPAIGANRTGSGSSDAPAG